METGRVYALLVFVVFYDLSCLSEARVFGRCELTRELLKNGFKKDFLSNWVCMIEQESDRNTSIVTEKSSKRKNYGLFQIGSEWCKEGRKGGKCVISCEELVDEDIRNDVVCVQKVWESEGFKYWPKWETRCKLQRLPDVDKCPDYLYPPSRPKRKIRSTRNARRIRRSRILDSLLQM